MPEIPAAYIETVDLVLRMLDPRVADHQRDEAAAFVEESPNFVIGLLASIIEDYHRRADNAACAPGGAMIDRLRARLLGDIVDDDTLAAALTAPDPRQPAQGNAGGSGPAHADSGNPPASPQPQRAPEAHPVDEDLQLRIAALQATVRDTRTAWAEPAAGEIPIGLTQLDEIAERIPPAFAARLRVATCGEPAESGPCTLRPGHLSGAGLPGWGGHIHRIGGTNP